MNNEEAIKYGIEWLEDEYLDAGDRAFIELALEALKQMPVTTTAGEGGVIYYPQVEGVTPTVIDVGKQEPCEMTAEEYRQRMIQAFHNADTDELIAVCVLPTEKEFEHLEWLLKNHYKKEPCGNAIDRAEAIKVASGYCHPANVAKELAKLPSVNPQPCEDAISKQAVLDCLTTTKLKKFDFILQARAEIKKLPPVNPTKTGHWIPVSERLPKIADVYRVTRYYPNNVMNPNYLVDACFFDGSNTWYNDNRINHERDYANNVIAWQENPEPYKVEPQESEDRCKNCEYYRNPDYTRCHECKAESEDKE